MSPLPAGIFSALSCPAPRSQTPAAIARSSREERQEGGGAGEGGGFHWSRSLTHACWCSQGLNGTTDPSVLNESATQWSWLEATLAAASTDKHSTRVRHSPLFVFRCRDRCGAPPASNKRQTNAAVADPQFLCGGHHVAFGHAGVPCRQSSDAQLMSEPDGAWQRSWSRTTHRFSKARPRRTSTGTGR